MLCEHCGEREANVHISRNINGRKTELHLCEQCAKQTGQMVSMNRFFNDFFESVMPIRARRPVYISQAPVSRYSGCEDCLEDAGGGIKVAGREEDLRARMKAAVAREDFEEAARLRDEIKKLEDNR